MSKRATNSRQSSVRSADTTRDELIVVHKVKNSWRGIANLEPYKGIPPGTLCAIAKGYPIPKKWYKRLGLQVMAPAPVCLKCGEIHVTKRCTAYSHRIKKWRDLKPEQLRWALENRYDV